MTPLPVRNPMGWGSPTESYAKGTKWGLYQMRPAGSLRNRMSGFPSSHERGGPFCRSPIPLPHALW